MIILNIIAAAAAVVKALQSSSSPKRSERTNEKGKREREIDRQAHRERNERT